MKTGKKNMNNDLSFHSFEQLNLNDIKLAEPLVPAGFPSPADDFVEMEINLQDYIVKNKEATFCVKVEGSSMTKAGINTGDIMIVDRSLTPKHNDIVLAVIDGDFTVKRLAVNDNSVYLVPENDSFSPIKITELMDFQVWGIITHIIHRAR
ncbi:MAG: LexA family protein [Flavobacteriales bacterium]|jgi:DNA polymerase V|tara:strand:- start:7308 stop:7760 length:453 start_codon:yes stop_codon:yes gene_type:complete